MRKFFYLGIGLVLLFTIAIGTIIFSGHDLTYTFCDVNSSRLVIIFDQPVGDRYRGFVRISDSPVWLDDPFLEYWFVSPARRAWFVIVIREEDKEFFETYLREDFNQDDFCSLFGENKNVY